MRIDNYYAVIMAGGGGTRLWPMSRKSRPKQMLSLDGGRTLFQRAVDRLEGVFNPAHIFIVTVEEQASSLQAQCPQIPTENYLIEPLPRGTASVVGFAAVNIHHRDSEGVMAVLTADHFIENEELFESLLMDAYLLAKQGSLVTLGIEPSYPATGYGYIQAGQSLEMETLKNEAYHVNQFREKPDLETASGYLKIGDFFWNSGMFIWQVKTILHEFERQMPQLFALLNSIGTAIGTELESVVIEKLWPTIRPETIDYGIMEHAHDVTVILAKNLGWNDVGSWDSLEEVLQKDENGNILISSSHIGVDTNQSVICSDGSKRLIVTIGSEELIIVDTEDVLLVCAKSEAQRVKEIVNHLKRTGLEKYL